MQSNLSPTNIASTDFSLIKNVGKSHRPIILKQKEIDIDPFYLS